MLHQRWPLWAEEHDIDLLRSHHVGVLLWSFYPGYTLLAAGVSSVSDIRIVSIWFFLIVYHEDDFEIVFYMNCIDNAASDYYKTLSFLYYLSRNMDIFLLIFQPSEFLSIYIIVITI